MKKLVASLALVAAAALVPMRGVEASLDVVEQCSAQGTIATSTITALSSAITNCTWASGSVLTFPTNASSIAVHGGSATGLTVVGLSSQLLQLPINITIKQFTSVGSLRFTGAVCEGSSILIADSFFSYTVFAGGSHLSPINLYPLTAVTSSVITIAMNTIEVPVDSPDRIFKGLEVSRFTTNCTINVESNTIAMKRLGGNPSMYGVAFVVGSVKGDASVYNVLNNTISLEGAVSNTVATGVDSFPRDHHLNSGTRQYRVHGNTFTNFSVPWKLDVSSISKITVEGNAVNSLVDASILPVITIQDSSTSALYGPYEVSVRHNALTAAANQTAAIRINVAQVDKSSRIEIVGNKVSSFGLSENRFLIIGGFTFLLANTSEFLVARNTLEGHRGKINASAFYKLAYYSASNPQNYPLYSKSYPIRFADTNVVLGTRINTLALLNSSISFNSRAPRFELVEDDDRREFASTAYTTSFNGLASCILALGFIVASMSLI